MSEAPKVQDEYRLKLSALPDGLFLAVFVGSFNLYTERFELFRN